jgi:hypothetical protein
MSIGFVASKPASLPASPPSSQPASQSGLGFGNHKERQLRCMSFQAHLVGHLSNMIGLGASKPANQQARQPANQVWVWKPYTKPAPKYAISGTFDSEYKMIGIGASQPANR